MHFKQIASYDNFMLANMTLGLLQEYEINCHLKDENTITIDPLLSPAIGGIKLMVQEADFEKAQSLLKKTEEAYLSEIPCPNCKSLSLTVEEKTNIPDSFWGTLKNLILYGQRENYTKKYRCKNCKNIFNEIPPGF